MSRPAQHLESDPNIAWRFIREYLQERLPRQSFLTWFNPVEPIALENNELSLRVPSRFYCDWIESHYSKHLNEAVISVLGGDVRVAYVVESNGKKIQIEDEKSEPQISIERKKKHFDSNLNSQYTFRNFIEGDCNRFARAAALAIADKPGETPFNPLMVYGGSGLGKTHLIQAIGNSIAEKKSHLRVLYVTSEQFTADFVTSIKLNQVTSFGKLYRSVDVLLLDDVQFFMAKEKTQEEFFHTFNTLHQGGKQLIFSSDRPPRELDGFDKRLVSRLQWGLVSELHIPDIETRMAILKDHAEKNRFEIPEDVIQFLATNIKDNVRSLQGALIHLLAQASLLGDPITLELAKRSMPNFINRPQLRLSIDRIQEIVADEFNIPSDLLRSKTRKRDIAEPRQIAMYLSTEYSKLTLKAIGLQFGGRDHTTVIHAREKISEKMKVNPNLQDTIEKLKRKIELSTL